MDTVVTPHARRFAWVLALMALILSMVVIATDNAQAVCRVALDSPTSVDEVAPTGALPEEPTGGPGLPALELTPEFLAPADPAEDDRLLCGGGGGPLVGLSRGNFRTNLIRWTPTTTKTVTNYHAHHVFPVKFEAKFKARDLNIHHPRYGAWWAASPHLKSAASYNAQWDAFFIKYPRATQGQILQEGRRLAAKYSLRSWF